MQFTKYGNHSENFLSPVVASSARAAVSMLDFCFGLAAHLASLAYFFCKHAFNGLQMHNFNSYLHVLITCSLQESHITS